MNISRRSFLRGATTAAAVVAVPSVAQAAIPAERTVNEVCKKDYTEANYTGQRKPDTVINISDDPDAVITHDCLADLVERINEMGENGGPRIRLSCPRD